MTESAIDKSRLLEEMIGRVEEALRRMEAGYATARQATLDSPHVMKSKREVAGIEASYLANAFAGNIEERQHDLRVLRGLRLPESPSRVALGCVVGIGPSGGPVEHLYFLLPVCGGMEIPLQDGGRAVRIVTPGTPVARALLGKSLGEEVALRTASGQTGCVTFLA